MPAANQSSTLNSLMDAVQSVLQFETGLASDYVVENYDDVPQPRGEPYAVYFRLVDESPFLHPGAGRIGSPSFLILETTLFTRLSLDVAGSDELWSRDTGRGALIMRETIRNALVGHNLFASYDANSGLATGVPLTIEPLMQVQAPSFAEKAKKVPNFGQHRMYFRFNMVQPLT